MNIHRQIIGTSWIIIGALFISLLVLRLGSGKTLLTLAGLTVGLVYFLAGFALVANLRNSYRIAIPCALLSIFTFPIGTPFGIYYLWYYFRVKRANGA
jgi:hypothetical protein